MSDDSTDPGFSAKAHKAALRAHEAARGATDRADPYFDRALHWLAGKWWTPIAVVIVCLPFVWLMVKAILYVLGAF